MGCCSSGSVETSHSGQPTKRQHHDDSFEKPNTGPKMKAEDVAERRKKIVESAEKRAEQHANKGLTKEAVVEQKVAEEKMRRVEQYQKDNPRGDFALQYKA